MPKGTRRRASRAEWKRYKVYQRMKPFLLEGKVVPLDLAREFILLDVAVNGLEAIEALTEVSMILGDGYAGQRT